MKKLKNSMIWSNGNSNYQVITLLINYHDNKLLWLHEFLRNGLVTYTSFGKVLLYSTENRSDSFWELTSPAWIQNPLYKPRLQGKIRRTGTAEKNWRLPLNSYKKTCYPRLDTNMKNAHSNNYKQQISSVELLPYQSSRWCSIDQLQKYSK